MSWPTSRPEVLALIQRAAELVLEAPPEWIEQLHAASFAGERMRPIVEDPALAEAVRRVNVANVRHWATANCTDPGRRVPPNLGPEALSAARDLVRRGLDESSLDAYRTSYTVVWKHFMDICFALTDDHEQLRELLELAAVSVSTFIEDTVSAVTAQMQTERADLTAGTHAERRATISLLLEGAPIRRAQAELQLGYRLTGPHTAAVVWASSPNAGEQLEAAAEVLMATGGATHRLTVVASAATQWLWLPVGTEFDSAAVTAGLAAAPEVQVAIGRAGLDLDGFRRSHLDALETQRMLARLPGRHLARYADIQLVSVLSADPIRAAEFVADTLGALAHAEPEVREAVTVYLETQCSTTKTAERLYTHRNTVVRRLARADELLPRPLAANAIAVGAALEMLRWSR